MKKFLLVSAVVCLIGGVAASVASAGLPVVAGAGYSTVSGSIVVNARATQSAPGITPLANYVATGSSAHRQRSANRKSYPSPA